MISPRSAGSLVLRTARALPSERVPLLEANGRVLTSPIRTSVPLPRFTSSSMDGYALRASDTAAASRQRPVRLRVAMRVVFAGSGAGRAIVPGKTVPVMTGAPLPRGVDAVLPWEEAAVEGGVLSVTCPVPRHGHVRRKGEDCRRGSVLAPAGTRIDPGWIALLAACGVSDVRVHRAPRAALVVTGDEVRSLSKLPIARYTAFDTHSSFLRAALGEFGLSFVTRSRARDRESHLRSRLERALRTADIVLVTGGVSMGTRDLVRPVLASLGVKTVFWGVSQKPGKPLFFGKKGSTLVFGLPGNPVSTVVCYCEYVRPCIQRMLGLRDESPEKRVLSLSRPLPRLSKQTWFVRGKTAPGPGAGSVAPILPEASHRYGPFRESDCLIAVAPDARGPLRRGARVTVHPFPWRKP